MKTPTAWLTYRTVILDPGAQLVVNRHTKIGSRFQEQWDGIEWLLSRTPIVGVPHNRNAQFKNLLYVVAGCPTSNLHTIWVLYSYGNTDVVIHAVNVI